MDDLSAILADLEAERGNLPAIANAAGVSYMGLINILKGRTPNPRYATVAAIRRALDQRKHAAASAP